MTRQAFDLYCQEAAGDVATSYDESGRLNINGYSGYYLEWKDGDALCVTWRDSTSARSKRAIERFDRELASPILPETISDL